MDLKDEIKVGDKVLCVKEKDLPSFVGKVWIVRHVTSNLFYCQNKKEYISPNRQDLYKDCFPFQIDEITPITPLMEELL